MNNDPPPPAALRAIGLDLDAFGAAEFDRDLANVIEALLREARTRLGAQMQAVRTRHIDLATKLKGSIVPKTDHLGRPVLTESGHPKNERLVLWYEIRYDCMKPSANGLTFPTLYWFKRSGGQVTIRQGPSANRKVCMGARMSLPEDSLRYAIGSFTAANVKERELIDQTEALAEPLRAQARYYRELWERTRRYRLSASYLTRFPPAEGPTS